MPKYYGIINHEEDDSYLMKDDTDNLQVYESRWRAKLRCPDYCKVEPIYTELKDYKSVLNKVSDRLKAGDLDEWSIEALIQLIKEA